MADDIAQKVSNLKITAAEENLLVFDEEVGTDSGQDIALSLVGKVLTVRSFNFEALKRTLNQIWAISNGALFRTIENGFFVVQFASLRDKSKVMAGRPWTFDQNLVLLNEIEGDLQPSNLSLTRCPFWVRLYNLPLAYRTERHVNLIGGCLGDVQEVDSDGIRWDTSARVRVLLDVTKPLRRVQKIALKTGAAAMIELKYERLPTFCYVCGLIGHIERDCLKGSEEDKETGKQWGSWLRASPRRGRQKMEEEAKLFLSCARNLDFGGSKKDDVEPCSDQIAHTSSCDSHAGGLILSGVVEGKLPGVERVDGGVETVTKEVEASVIPSPPFVFHSAPKNSVGKNRKNKIKSRVVPMEINDLTTKNIEKTIIGPIGEKRKLPDPMVVNDAVEGDFLGVKKLKFDELVLPGSEEATVEAEVGVTQPRPVL